MIPSQLLIAAIVGCAVVATLAGIAERGSSQVAAAALPPSPLLVSSTGSSAQRNFPSLAGATGWLNSPPLTPEGLRGKVVLVEFWTFTCINWRRQAPYVRAWAEKYKDQGLVVIGVHTPEFEFEMEDANVQRAARSIPVGYPIAIDSEHKVWRAFANQYWPALYFIDATGKVRHQQFGEGEYEQSERVIQRLLIEAGRTVTNTALVHAPGRGPEAAPDLANLRSPENYLGYGKASNFDSVGGITANEPRLYAVPARLRANHWGLAGDWTVKGHASLLNKRPGRLAYGFHARDLHLVMGPSKSGAPVRFKVLIDGQPPGLAAGSDIDALGVGLAGEQRMYHLIRQQAPVGDRRFEIEFLDPDVEVYSISFG